MGEPLTEAQQEARQHFERAKQLYQTGAYREAVAELEQARSLDPNAKDLVFNLGVVSERLGAYDDALTYFNQYVAMETVTEAERTKTETMIRRIEGAKREAAERQAAEASPQPTEAAPAPATPESGKAPKKAPRGRIDAATITAASVALVGVGVGTVFGIRALSLDTSDFVTGRDGTYQAFQTQTNDAHTSAIVADVGFGVGIVAAVVAGYLYFGRPKAASPSLSASAGPLPGGGAIFLGGAFQ